MRYTVIVEKGRNGYGAYVPDLPGCGATAKTEGEVIDLIREGIEIYIGELKARGENVPEPNSKSTEIEVRA